MNGKKEFGDYQTPNDFAKEVCRYLKETKKISPKTILEPTCGIGNFIKNSQIFGAEQIVGIEINPDYCEICKNQINDSNVTIYNQNIFDIETKLLLNKHDNLLILGNPPWVTNCTLSSINSTNLPLKKNFKALKGIDAITGASNFDICENIILKLIDEYKNTNSIIAMLCKTSVARNVFIELKRQEINFAECELIEFDSSKVFGISASSCLLFIRLSTRNCSPDFCTVKSFSDITKVKSQFGYVNDKLYSNMSSSLINFDGECCFEWRQGIKHDCSKIMELSKKDNMYINGNKEVVNIEENLIYPLIKSSMFKKPIINSFSKYIIVTQKKVGENTDWIRDILPKTWTYLDNNLFYFEKRGSSIYKNAPKFSMFGVGDYSYAPYKVGISGFYKNPLFSILYLDDEHPVMADDTCYFISFYRYNTAYVAMLMLNNKLVQDFVKSIAFLDSKRPYSKKVLCRIDFSKILNKLTFENLLETEQKLQIDNYLTLSMYNEFKDIVYSKCS